MNQNVKVRRILACLLRTAGCAYKRTGHWQRLLRLQVKDRNTGAAASAEQRALRSLLFFIYPLDGVVMLVTGRSIGDRIANTSIITYT